MDNTTYKIELWEKICARDDMGAFESLFHLLNKKLIRFCTLYVDSTEVAEEIVADVFVKCWEERKSKKEIANIESYLFISVKNRSLNHLKKYSRIHWSQLRDGNSYELPELFDPEKQLEFKELSFKMEQAVQALPMQARIIFRLIKEDGMKYKDAAEILDISPKTVQTQLYRAIQKLSAVFEICRADKASGKKIISVFLLAGFLQLFFSCL